MAGDSVNALQLTLGVRLRDDATFANFLGQRNAVTADRLRQSAAEPDWAVIFLCGDSGTGKSHLLQALCHHADEQGRSALCLNLGEMAASGPGVLEGLAYHHLICLDDLDSVLQHPGWEEALFHLFNRVQDLGHHLVIAARQPPATLAVGLDDLASRLRQGLVLQLSLPSDRDRQDMLQVRARTRGLVLSEEVSRYILRRAPRHTGDLLAILERLDQRSLRDQRRLTIPFVRTVMEW
jgi:DnaA family protein